MGIVILAAVLVAIVGAVVTGVVVWRHIHNEARVLRAKHYEHCTLMRQTARTEESVYGHVVSGSVANHVENCNHCKFVLGGDYKDLNAHRADMSILEKEWK